MKVRVHDHTGNYAITLDDGQAVFDSIYPPLSDGQKVELDFEDVEIFASPFFNAAIGQLLRGLSPETLNDQLKVTNLDSDGKDVMKRVIANAQRYYADGSYRETLHRVLAEELETS